MKPELASWFGGDDTGTSSLAIATHMLGGKLPARRFDAPHDPSDLGRCLRLLAIMPEWTPRMGEMARYGAVWRDMAARWDELSRTMEAEVGIDWSKGQRAPATYALMQAIRKGRP